MTKLTDKFTQSLRSPAVLAAIGGVASLALGLAAVLVLLSTGRPKAVSDNAALIGALVALGGVFTAQIVSIALENQRALHQRYLEQQRAENDALQRYLERMGQLLTKEQLRGSKNDSNVRVLARAQTLVILQSVGSDPKRSVPQFLYESALISRDPDTVIELSGANLIGANLDCGRSGHPDLGVYRRF